MPPKLDKHWGSGGFQPTITPEEPIKYFISAVNIKNFTMAALENNISQSAFSKQIISLEAELGTELFSRKKRNIELTLAGEKFLPYAQRLLNVYGEMLRGMANYSNSSTLPISISSIPVLKQYCLIDLIVEMQKKFPDTVFSVSELAESTNVMRALYKGECDFAIMRTDFLEADLYDTYPIIKDRLVAILPGHHRLAGPEVEQIGLRQLANDSFVMPPEKTDLRVISSNACIKSGFRPAVTFISSGNLELTLDLVEKREIVYLAFENVVADSVRKREGRVVIRNLNEVIESYTAFVTLKSRPQTEMTRKIADFLQRHISAGGICQD